jgi:2-polyprenyl-3-methyl-5-hydroxy-6-metoxy-1,4-benzoquinol methylase
MNRLLFAALLLPNSGTGVEFPRGTVSHVSTKVPARNFAACPRIGRSITLTTEWDAALRSPLAAGLSAQAPNSNDQIWNVFVHWLEAQPPNSKPGELIAAYKTNLIRERVPQVEADRRMRVIGEFIFTRRKGTEILWDKVFAGGNPIFLQTPNALVRSAVLGRKPGKALDVGMGQGRNSIFLAAQGWDVTGFDPSEEGVRIAQSNAGKAGVQIHALVARDDEFEYGSDRWDLIVVTYVRDLTAEDARLFRRALRHGGIVVYENGADRGNAVLRAFLGYRIVRFEDVETTPDWNPQNKIRVQRLIAEKDGS